MLDSFTCKKCNTSQPQEDFPKVKENISGYGHSCKKCIAVYQKEWAQKDREEKLARNREAARRYSTTEKGMATALVKKASRYGISGVEYTAVMTSNKVENAISVRIETLCIWTTAIVRVRSVAHFVPSAIRASGF